jgi:cytochrome c553
MPRIHKKKPILVPKKLSNIKTQHIRERKMYDYINRLSDKQINDIINSYHELQKSVDGETFANIAALVKLKRKL